MKKIKVEKVEVNPYDVMDLACKIMGIDFEDDLDYDDIDAGLYELLDIDLETLEKVVERLLPLIAVRKSPITDVVFKGFVDKEQEAWILYTISKPNKE